MAGGTLGNGVPEVAVKTDGRAETVVLPPGYGAAVEIGDTLVALLKQALQVTVDQRVLYVVDVSGTVETAATDELGVMYTVDWKVLVIVDVVWKVRVDVLLPITVVEVSEHVVV